MNDEQTVKVFKLLSDPTRIKIIKKLSKCDKCACSILQDLEVTQPTLSHHMKLLEESNFVISVKDGKKTFYSLNKSTILELMAFLESIYKK